MYKRTATTLLSLAMLTMVLATPAALATGPNADGAAGDETEGTQAGLTLPTSTHSGAGEVFVYDDGNAQHAAQAASNLAIPHTTSSDTCELAEAAQSGAYNTLIVNIQIDWGADCDESLYAHLAAHAEEPGNSLILQSWEIAYCDASWAYCSVDDAEAVLSALGVASDTTLSESPPSLQASETVNACAAVPNPLVPTVDAIEPTRDVLILDAVGVQAEDGVPCLVDGDGNAQLVTNENGAYMGFAPTNYEGGTSTTAPGPQDMVKLFEDLIVTNV
jgi:hypothetical protein